MSYSIEGSSHACYEGTSCLINKLDIRDEAKLEEVEGAFSLSRASLLESNPGKAMAARSGRSLLS